jgi:hypothetical protein
MSRSTSFIGSRIDRRRQQVNDREHISALYKDKLKTKEAISLESDFNYET